MIRGKQRWVGGDKPNPMHILEREKLQALSQGSQVENYKERIIKQLVLPIVRTCYKVLVKHISFQVKNGVKLQKATQVIWRQMKKVVVV
ncbi:hypothetical protein TSUD_43550 [Trifolium subterraneum]|uniref:Uncharacterized protein n=1 Tax=Trifolium subterraneum TaxID=3900 RepID=A0A2Z6MRM3_TRISU|nr:hypothetical protein TSUD_43550 [Trifolium subterraneum]